MDYKVLLVDDEILILDYLEHLISWNDFQCTVVGKAVTARRALAIAEETKPDFIFMDIKMPVMDGLTLSKRILKQHPQCRIIVLTAYSDFEYAKQAIGLGISQFLLKHELTAPLLSETLQTAVEQLKSERTLYIHAAGEQLYQAFVCGNSTTFPTQLLHPKSQYWLTILKTPELSFWGAAAAAPLEQACYDSIKQVLQSKECICAFTRLQQNAYLLLCQIPESVSQKSSNETQLSAIFELDAALQEASLPSLQLFYSACFTELDSIVSLGTQYRHLIQSITLKYRPIQPLSDFTKNKEGAFLFPSSFVADFIAHCKQTEAGPSSLCMQAFFEISGSFIPTEQLHLFHHLFQELSKLRSKWLLPEYTALLPSLLQQYRLNSFDHFVHWLADEQSLLQQTAKQRLNSNQTKIAHALHLIHRQFHEDLSADFLAEQLNLSSGYLRAIFKSEMGCTIHDYIEEYRIQKAKELLDMHLYKMYEIAEQCGFKTSQHFSQVFKQRTDLSPKEYLNGGGKANDASAL